MRSTLLRLGISTTALVISCRDAGSRVFPDTPLGRTGRDWLAAHNRAEGHAAVHFTLENRGSAPASGAQTDSIVQASVRFAQSAGRLVPVRLLYSTDTALVVLLRSADTASRTWTGRFSTAVQPSIVKVHIEILP